MAKHKARFWDHPAAYESHALTNARAEFLRWARFGSTTGNWIPALELRLRGRQGSQVRAWSERLQVRTPKRWW